MPIHIRAPQRFLRFCSLIFGGLWGLIIKAVGTDQPGQRPMA